MASRIRNVLRNRNKRDRELRESRRNSINQLNEENVYRAALYEDMKWIDGLLKDDEVEVVEVVIPIEEIGKFEKCLYSEEMADFLISQGDEPNIFFIRKRLINF